MLSDKFSGLSSDGSFGSRFKKIRKKPKKPEPYHKHIEQKKMVRNTFRINKSAQIRTK